MGDARLGANLKNGICRPSHSGLVSQGLNILFEIYTHVGSKFGFWSNLVLEVRNKPGPNNVRQRSFG